VDPVWEPAIHNIVYDFCLNKEQTRAFQIVAHHAAACNSEQLKMYMGGMGGTRKTQVLKALKHYFDAQQESHQLAIVAPIKTNLAMELCITNGQEGHVYGWKSCVGSSGQRMLDMLFVKLQNLPHTVQIEGLPGNVVPVT
ncbi:hypothetical protein J132_04027, partial [Termitomyces sp. J132]